MKILIVESASHYKVLENVYHLIKLNRPKSEISFYVNKDKGAINKKLRELLFPESEKINWIVNPFHGSQFFMLLIFLGWKYDLINVSTGPESPHYSNIFNVIFFYIASRIYGKKIVLTIKNSRPYLKSTPGIMPYIRSSALRYLRTLTFETKTLMEVFHEETNIPCEKLGVSYDRYTDLNKINEQDSTEKDNQYICIFGLLGMVEAERRNYYEIINALKEMPQNIRSKFLFVTLGNTNGGLDNKILADLNKITNVDITNGWISAEDFEKRGLMCDVLISPLRNDMEYGTYKGSGTFGDALYLRKKLIIPSHTDPRSEFSDISIYYDSQDSLINIFSHIEDEIRIPVSIEYYDNFTTEKIYKNLYKVINN